MKELKKNKVLITIGEPTTKKKKMKKLLKKPKLKKNKKSNCSFKDLVTITCPEDTKPSRFINKFLYQDDIELHPEDDVEDYEALEVILEESEILMEKSKKKSKVVDIKPKKITTPKQKPIVVEEIINEPIIIHNELFNIFETPKGQLLLIEENSVVYFHGLINVKVIYGGINILGRNIDKNHPNVDVFSPRGSSRLSINNRNIFDDKNKLLQYSKIININEMEKKALILCKPVKNQVIDFMIANTAQVMYPPIENGLQCNFLKNTDDVSVYKVSDEWDQIVTNFKEDSRVILCGGKGVGKSTLLRYLINQLLGNFDKILVIDLDPGQPEFTIPGCVSASIVKSPLMGPNYTHLQQPERCYLVPDINIAADCDNYLSSVKELLISCSDLPKMPTIINYMGYTKGLGVNLISTVITEVQPTLVVQIEGPPSRNFPTDLSIPNVKYYRALFDDSNIEINYNLLKIKSVKVESNNWEIEPRFIRELLVLAYIGQILPDGCDYLTHRNVPVYRTNLSEIKVISNGNVCDPMAANANLVALCKSSNNIFECFGWGIVRAVCKERYLLLLSTPIDEDILDKMEHLVLGVVNLPPSVYLRQDNNIRGIIPYVYEGKITNFAQAPKRFPNFKK